MKFIFFITFCFIIQVYPFIQPVFDCYLPDIIPNSRNCYKFYGYKSDEYTILLESEQNKIEPRNYDKNKSIINQVFTPSEDHRHNSYVTQIYDNCDIRNQWHIRILYLASSNNTRCTGYIGACCLKDKCIETNKLLCENKLGVFKGETSCRQTTC